MRYLTRLLCVQWLVVACGGSSGSDGEQRCSGANAIDCDAGQTGAENPDGAIGETTGKSSSTSDVESHAETPDSAVTGSVPDAALTGSLPDGAAVQCCPISDQPACCMDYGGADLEGCGAVCDGMPWPSDDWARGLDKFGCPIWIEPPRTADFCGAIPPELDAGDAQAAVVPDADIPDAALADGSAGDAAAVVTLPDGALVECCPISPEPNDCMEFGGAAVGGCGIHCDCLPGRDEGWTLGADRFGCPLWIAPYDPCEGDPRDSGMTFTDAAVATDASAGEADGVNGD